MSHHREAIKRLNSDLKKFNEKPTPGISIAISESNALELFARYDSLPNTPYDGLYPILKITATDMFPFQAPTVEFYRQIYHINVESKRDVCLQSIAEWNINHQVRDIIDEVQSLLLRPNEDNAVSQGILFEYRNLRSRFNGRARRLSAEMHKLSVQDKFDWMSFKKPEFVEEQKNSNEKTKLQDLFSSLWNYAVQDFKHLLGKPN